MLIIHNFVVFEGGDGSGTSTQLDLLKKRLAGGGPSPAFHPTFEPTGGPIGTLIRSALRGDLSLERETLARLFAADRTEHLYGENGILRRCGRGELVVSDRYTLSSLVYQGIDCGGERAEYLNRDFPGPELLLFFDLDPETALKRLESREARDIYERLEFQVRVYRRYRELLPQYAARGVRVEYIDASESPEEVAGAVWSALGKLPIMQ